MSQLINQSWNYHEPSATEQQYDMQLMTICGVSVLGRWSGALGEHYVGWCTLLGATKSQLKAYPSEHLQFDDHFASPITPSYVN